MCGGTSQAWLASNATWKCNVKQAGWVFIYLFIFVLVCFFPSYGVLNVPDCNQNLQHTVKWCSLCFQWKLFHYSIILQTLNQIAQSKKKKKEKRHIGSRWASESVMIIKAVWWEWTLEINRAHANFQTSKWTNVSCLFIHRPPAIPDPRQAAIMAALFKSFSFVCATPDSTQLIINTWFNSAANNEAI